MAHTAVSLGETLATFNVKNVKHDAVVGSLMSLMTVQPY